MLIVKDRFFVLANDVSLIVLFHSMTSFCLTGFGIVNRNDFLRCTSLAAGVDTCRFYWSKDPASRTTGTTGHQSHDLPLSQRSRGRYHLFVDLRGTIEFNPGLHQLA